MSRWLKGLGLVVIVLALLIVAGVALLNMNLRGALERVVSDRTGRELAINGDFQWKLDWPHARLHAADVTFANPSWAKEKQMLTANAVDISVHLPRLVSGKFFLSDVRLERPVIFFERGADGRRNWVLDQN